MDLQFFSLGLKKTIQETVYLWFQLLDLQCRPWNVIRSIPRTLWLSTLYSISLKSQFSASMTGCLHPSIASKLNTTLIVLLIAAELCIQSERALGIRDLNMLQSHQPGRHHEHLSRKDQQIEAASQSKGFSDFRVEGNHYRARPPAANIPSSSDHQYYYDSKRRVPNCPDPLHNR